MKLSPKCRTSFLKRLEMNPSGRPLCHSPDMTNMLSMLNYVKIYIIICNYVCIYICIYLLFRFLGANLQSYLKWLFYCSPLLCPAAIHSYICVSISTCIYTHVKISTPPSIYIPLQIPLLCHIFLSNYI